MEMEILSQDLRKAKLASVFTSHIEAIQTFAKEQQQAQGNFPGPCPIIYNGDANFIKQAIKSGASAIVIKDLSLLLSSQQLDTSDTFHGVDFICQVENVQQVKTAMDSGYEYAFLIKHNDNNHDNNENDSSNNSLIVEILSHVPKDAIVIFSLPSMQKNSHEINKGKEIVQLSSTDSLSNINGLVFENACVGDDEDLKYANFLVGAVTKKGSSTFAKTGLTGSTNGNFGTLSDNVSIQDAKWKRLED